MTASPTPLLTEEEASEAREALRFFAEPALSRDFRDPFLLQGASAHALLFHYLSRFEPGEGRWQEGEERCVEAVIDGLGEVDFDLSFLGGLAGAGWTLRHLYPDLDAETLEALDEIFLEVLEDEGFADDSSVMRGPVGIGWYALEGEVREIDCRLVEKVLERIGRSAIPGPDGISWQRVGMEGQCDLGLAHGVTGMLTFLTRALAAGFDGPHYHLARGAIEWLLAQRLPESGYARYPLSKVPGGAPHPAGPGWLEGELGIAFAVLAAAEALALDDWRKEAWRSMLATWAALPATAQRGDFRLLSGLLGEAHILGRLYRSAGEGGFRDSAAARIRLVTRSARFWRQDQGAPEPDGPGLAGSAGQGLALLAALDAEQSGWDRVLLLS